MTMVLIFYKKIVIFDKIKKITVMKTMDFLKLVKRSTLVLLLFSFGFSYAKSYEVKFYEKSNDLVISLDENPDGLFSEFYLIKLISPLNKSIFKDGKYKIKITDGVLILKSKEKTLILTTDKKVIQTGFRQRGVFYIWVNAIAKGESLEPIMADDVFYKEISEKPFEKDGSVLDLGEFKLEIISKNERYLENLELGYF